MAACAQTGFLKVSASNKHKHAVLVYHRRSAALGERLWQLELPPPPPPLISLTLPVTPSKEEPSEKAVSIQRHIIGPSQSGSASVVRLLRETNAQSANYHSCCHDGAEECE